LFSRGALPIEAAVELSFRPSRVKLAHFFDVGAEVKDVVNRIRWFLEVIYLLEEADRRRAPYCFSEIWASAWMKRIGFCAEAANLLVKYWVILIVGM
jgi:hypothetical protein